MGEKRGKGEARDELGEGNSVSFLSAEPRKNFVRRHFVHAKPLRQRTHDSS